MTFQEKVNALKETFKSRITAESSPEEVEALNKHQSDLDELVVEHNKVVEENAKFRDTIVRMVSTQGSSDKPKDESDGSKPKTIEECVAEQLIKEGK